MKKIVVIGESIRNLIGIEGYDVLGTYKTKERAIEVLDEIELFLTDCVVIVYHMPKE